MKPRLIVHIGTLKTGALAIQRTLHERKGALVEECDALYASTERGGQQYRHASVRRAAVGQDAQKADAEYGALMTEFERSGASTLIISDQDLFSTLPSVPEFFRRFTPTFDVDVVCFLRRTDYFIEALYEHAMRTNKFRDTATIVDFWRDPDNRPRFDAHAILSGWQAIGANVTVLNHALETDDGEGVVNVFLRACGITPWVGVAEDDSSSQIDFRLLATQVMIASEALQEDQPLLKALTKAAHAVAHKSSFSPLPGLLGQLERHAVLESFQATHDALKADFGVEFDDDMPDNEGEDAVLAPESGYILGLIGQMSIQDTLRFQQACQRYLLARVEALED